MQDIAKLLASLQKAAAKLSELNGILDVPNHRLLSNKAALYLLDCTAMLEEGGLRQGQALNRFVQLSEAFCAEVEGLEKTL
jgi:hypothetical protein